MKSEEGHVILRTNKINTDPCGEGGVRQIVSLDCGLVSRCVVKADEIGEAVLSELNISGRDVSVKEDSKMARGETCVDGTLGRKVNTVPVIVSEVDTEVIEEEATPVIETIDECQDLVPRNLKQIGCANLTEMDIRLNDDKPVLYRPYRMSFNKCEQVKDNVQELIATDIMESTHGCRVHREEKEYDKRRLRLSGIKDGIGDVPVVLDGNNVDQVEDSMMLSLGKGQWRNKVFGLIKQSVLWIVFKIVNCL
ncbi:hypothetical protein GEV33_005497 [Tenebrio molitor]|uniref:Uncharacterized protein n=1 Tax=Tenebrio molitor TaxID=7067 RepID=A0A8J6HMD7_TENMO|nr:hypothetical protein GEV33_005497 [Tenebrio molitor]